MAERLLVISDMWGVKKGLWITSYLGYLQQFYDIQFYDCQQLGNIDELVNSKENLHRAFVDGGIETAVAHLMKKETEACHVLAFGTGATIAWKAGIMGFQMKSLTAISPTRIRFEKERPNCAIDLTYGEYDSFKPDMFWAKQVGVEMNIVPKFGHELYSDEKVIVDVCKRLLKKVIQKPQEAPLVRQYKKGA